VRLRLESHAATVQDVEPKWPSAEDLLKSIIDAIHNHGKWQQWQREAFRNFLAARILSSRVLCWLMLTTWPEGLYLEEEIGHSSTACASKV